MRTRCQYPYHLVLPTGRHTMPCCGMDNCAWIPVFLIVLRRCFEFYFSCFVDKTLYKSNVRNITVHNGCAVE